MGEYTLEADAKLDYLSDIARFAQQSLAKLQLAPQMADRICLAIDEVATNVIMYAYPGGRGKIHLALRRDGDMLRVTITDHGVPFDPTQSAAPDLARPLEERPVGGLGIHLARSMVDEITYRRAGDANILMMTAQVKGATP